MSRASMTVRVLALALALALLTALPASAARARRTVVAASVPAAVHQGAALKVTGRVSPRARRPVLLLQKWGAKWLVVGRSTTTARGTYELAVPTARPGRFVYRVHVPAAKGRTAATSRARSVTVRRTAAAPGGSASSFSYLMGKKYRWNPCAAIGYRVNPRYAPRGWQDDVAGTMRRVTAESGLRFAYRGTTTVLPGAGNDAYPAGTQLVIGYAHLGESKYTSPGAAGIGGALGTAVSTSQGDVDTLVKGFVVINAEVNDGLAPGFGWGHRYGYQGTRGQLLMHEVGHATGLGHAERDRAQIMYPQMQDRTAAWGRGDIAGLTTLGARGGCIVPTPDSLGRRAPAPVRVVAMR